MLQKLDHQVDHPNYPKKGKIPINCKTPLHSFLIYISTHPKSWLIILIPLLQLLLILTFRSVPIRTISPFPKINTTNTDTDTNTNTVQSCDHGTVFVYQLPSLFNKNLSDGCHSLDPWNSRCTALSNGGFGPPATDLAGTVPENLLPAWFSTDQFASEIIYHDRILRHRCRTHDPESATAFYVPFYAGLAVGKFLWSNYSSEDRDRHCLMLLQWLSEQRPWKRNMGSDHFLMLGRITWDFRRSKDGDWGGSFLYMPGMQNMTRLLIERNPWDELDVGVPYPTGFHPRTDADIREWQQFVLNQKRSNQFSFAGATRSLFKDDFRAILLQQCHNAGGACRSVDCSGSQCSNSTSAALRLFLDSEFCLQPRGDSFTRRSIFDCMVAGSIPIFFWRRTAYLQYMWHLPAEPESYSVFIDRRDVKNGTSIRAVLESLGEEKVKQMRQKVVEYIPKLVYAAPKEGLEGFRDAFDVALEGVLKRFKEQKRIKEVSKDNLDG